MEAKIEQKFKEIFELMGWDLNNDSLKNTPKRMAKMYCRELFNYPYPKITIMENKFNYNQMIIVKDIDVTSICEHHLLPFIGTCNIAYIPDKKILGLSKFNRIVKYYCKRPQLQERLTDDIADNLKKILDTQNIAVMIKAIHTCVMARGIEDKKSSTITTSLNGRFLLNEVRNEFFQNIK
jgi:GTP cyclohydrolase I